MFNHRLLSFKELSQVTDRTGFEIRLAVDNKRYQYKGQSNDLVRLNPLDSNSKTIYVGRDQAFTFSPNKKTGPVVNVANLSQIWGEKFTCCVSASYLSDGLLIVPPNASPNSDGYIQCKRTDELGNITHSTWHTRSPDCYALYDREFETEREKKVQKQIMEFISKGFDENIEQLTFGFELETQETNGATCDNWRHLIGNNIPAFDYEEYKQAYEDAFDLYNATKKSYFPWPHTTTSALYSLFSPLGRVRMRAFMDAMGIETTDDLVSKGLTTQEEIDLILEAIHIERHRQPEGDDEDYYDFHKAFPNLPDTMEVVDDGSVRGFEFRTKGGLKLDEFNEAAEHIFGSEYNHTIDSRCSFHIHLRLGDIKHTFSRAKQQQMIKYLVSNMDRLPESVQKRWNDRDAIGFFDPAKQHQKYSFINFHEQGTMEFRCFGNIDNVEDAKICLRMSVEALRYAYTNKQKEITNASWDNAIKQCMYNRTGKSFDRIENLILTIETIAEEREKRIRQLEKDSQTKIDKVQQELNQQLAG